MAALAPLGVMAWPATAQDGGPPPYTEAQAARGQDFYFERCAVCHGPSLAGGPFGPSIGGARFKAQWGGKTAADLYDYLRTGMPPGQAESIAPEDHADAMAFVLAVNGIPPGASELPADSAKLKAYSLPK